MDEENYEWTEHPHKEQSVVCALQRNDETELPYTDTVVIEMDDKFDNKSLLSTPQKNQQTSIQNNTTIGTEQHIKMDEDFQNNSVLSTPCGYQQTCIQSQETVISELHVDNMSRPAFILAPV